jgi:hypothetical protein
MKRLFICIAILMMPSAFAQLTQVCPSTNCPGTANANEIITRGWTGGSLCPGGYVCTYQSKQNGVITFSTSMFQYSGCSNSWCNTTTPASNPWGSHSLFSSGENSGDDYWINAKYQLTVQLNPSDTTMTVDTVNSFLTGIPSTGYLSIEKEVVHYSAVNTSTGVFTLDQRAARTSCYAVPDANACKTHAVTGTVTTNGFDMSAKNPEIDGASTTVDVPPGRHPSYDQAYDSVHDSTLVGGGYNESISLGDLWLMCGSNSSGYCTDGTANPQSRKVFLVGTTLPRRQYRTIRYEPVADMYVMLGGASQGSPQAELYVFCFYVTAATIARGCSTAGTVTKIAASLIQTVGGSAVAIPALSAHNMYYDATAQAFVFWGGKIADTAACAGVPGAPTSCNNDRIYTLKWNGTKWEFRKPTMSGGGQANGGFCNAGLDGNNTNYATVANTCEQLPAGDYDQVNNRGLFWFHDGNSWWGSLNYSLNTMTFSATGVTMPTYTYASFSSGNTAFAWSQYWPGHNGFILFSMRLGTCTANCTPNTYEFKLSGDVTPPTVSLTNPAASPTLIGTATVTATASDDVGVSGVQFSYGGVNIGAEDTAAPYSVSWNTTTFANGCATLLARARDSAGNTADSTRTVCIDNGSSLRTQLTVQEELYTGVTGVTRTSGAVSAGLPLTKAAVPCGSSNPATCSGLASLGMGGTGVTMAQFRCLGVWPDNSCKWVQVDTELDVTAGTQNTSAYLTVGQGSFGGSNLATDGGSTISIDTGACIFVVKKSNYNVFDSVVCGATTLVSTGSTGLAILGPANPGNTCPSPIAGGDCATLYASKFDAASTCSIEQNGPVKSAIKCDGAFKDAGGNAYMKFTTRTYFFKGKSNPKLTVILRNADESTAVYFGYKSLEVRLSPSLGSGKTYRFGTELSDVTGTFAGSEDAYIYQAYSSVMENIQWRATTCAGASYNSDNPGCVVPYIARTGAAPYTYAQSGYEVRVGATTSQTGDATKTLPGWADLADSSGNGLMVAVNWMTPYWPKSLQLMGGGAEIRIGIWPDQTLWTETCNSTPCANPYYQAWPQYSIQDVFFNFHVGALASPAGEMKKLQHPLLARAPRDRYNTAGVFDWKIIDPTVEDSYYSSVGTSNSLASDKYCCIADLVPQAKRYWAWNNGGGDNQMDFRWANLLRWLQRGYTGNYWQAADFYRMQAEQTAPRSDGFAWRTHSPAGDLNVKGFPANVTPTNQVISSHATANRSWLDSNHAHWYGMIDYYFVSGDETMKDAILDGFSDRFISTTSGFNTGANFMCTRDVGSFLMSETRMWKFYTSQGLTTEAATAYSVADTVLGVSVFPATIMGGGYPAGQKSGTDYAIGLVYAGNCNLPWPNPPATAGPGGAGTTRYASAFQNGILLGGMIEHLRGRDPSTMANYNKLADVATLVAKETERQYFIPPTSMVCPNASDCGWYYYQSVDYAQNTDPTYSSDYWFTVPWQETVEAIWTAQYELLGKNNWKPNFDKWLARLMNSTGGVAALDDSATHLMWSAIDAATSSAKPNVAKVLINSVTDNGAGSYTVAWTPPAGAQGYVLRYDATGKTLVDTLGYTPLTATFAVTRASNQPWMTATRTATQPAAGDTAITVTGLPGGLPSSSFDLRALGPAADQGTVPGVNYNGGATVVSGTKN